VGADGVILLNNSDEADFEIKIYSPDGNERAMSGNGSRCAVNFAKKLGIVDGNELTFKAGDGIHKAEILEEDKIKVQMADVKEITFEYDSAIFNFEKPHYIKHTEYLGDADMVKIGRELRASDKRYKESGVNVSYLEYGTQALEVRTY